MGIVHVVMPVLAGLSIVMVNSFNVRHVAAVSVTSHNPGLELCGKDLSEKKNTADLFLSSLLLSLLF